MSSAVLQMALLLCGPGAAAQNGKFYSSSHDISNSLINAICQDSEGYIWTATEDGLNKFDGCRFTIYKHDGAEGSLSNDYVHSLLCDSRGRMWVGCINGLDRYDYAADTFSEMRIVRDGMEIHPHISCIMERRCGDIWFATSGQNIMILRTGSDSIEVMKDSPAYIHTLYEDIRGDVWIGTGRNGIFRFSDATGACTPHTPGGDTMESFEVSSFCESPGGTLYAGSIGGGVAALDRVSGSFMPIPYLGRNDLHIRSLLVSDDGHVLAGTDGEGLKMVSDDGRHLVDCDIYQEPADLSGAKIHSMITDRDGGLWLGLFQKGLCFIPRTAYKFLYFGYLSTTRNTIGSSCVSSIFTDRNGVIWIGTDTEGIYTIDATGRRIRHYLSGEEGRSTPTSVMAIFETSKGQIVAGSYHRGMSMLDRSTQSFVPVSGVNPGINRVTAFAEDSGHNLYVATLGSGVLRINLDSGDRRLFTAPTENTDPEWKEDRLNNDWVNCMTIDSDGQLWIGTYRGLSCYDIREDSFLPAAGTNNLLPDKIIQHITQDASGTIWIGSSEGLYSYSKKDGRFTLFTKEDGLPDNVICGLADDPQGCIWISTHHGISRYSPKEGIFTNFNEDDGLQGNEFSRGAAFRTAGGMILFGGINGVTAFYPWEIKHTPQKPGIVLTDFMVRDRSIRRNEGSDPQSGRFHLRYEDNTFRLEYSAMDFTNPGQIVWEHRIRELGREWSSDGPGVNHISYSYLKPGTYTIQTRALRSGIYSDINEIQVRIDPPWYLSWWMGLAAAAVAGALAIAVFSAFRARRKHLAEIEEQKRLESINEAKLQYFMNISHEIRNPMTLIISPLQKLLKEEDDPARKQSLLMMDRNAKRILRLINQLMDTRKIEKGQLFLKCRQTEIVGFIQDIKITFDAPAAERRIRFEFRHTDERLKVWIDLHNFDKVLLNLLSNAFKYTSDGGEIIIELTSGEDVSVDGPLRRWWQVSVTDDGIGLDEDKVEKIFERFYQVPNDMTNSYFSTGIGLHLARSLVLLHHGTITAANRHDTHGSVFTVRMPLGSAHLTPEELA